MTPPNYADILSLLLSAVKFPGSPEASVLQQQPLMPPLSDDDGSGLSGAADGNLRIQSYLKECPPHESAASDLGGQPIQGESRPSERLRVNPFDFGAT